MSQRTILFIMCVTDETLFEQAKRYIDDLIIPPNFSVNVLGIRGSHSLTSGYNTAAQVDAEFKIYIHQDVFITYKHILIDLVRLFDTHPELGMVGVAGCMELPASGIWWEGSPKTLVGKWISPFKKCHTLKGNKIWRPGMDYIPVESIDGLFMATRVDIPWREDLFDGFHFYDTSHSLEMKRFGYVVGIPASALCYPWCIHFHKDTKYMDTGAYHRYREIFLKNYAVFFKPGTTHGGKKYKKHSSSKKKLRGKK